MELVFSDSAKKELENVPLELKVLFLNRLDKMMLTPPRKRMKHGIPCHVVKVPNRRGSSARSEERRSMCFTASGAIRGMSDGTDHTNKSISISF